MTILGLSAFFTEFTSLLLLALKTRGLPVRQQQGDIAALSHNGSTFPGTEALMKEIGAIIDQYGADDEDLVCIPLSRYDELLRSESEIDILCTLVESPHVESKTALAALESVADMRDKRLNDCEDDTDEE